MLRLLHDVLTGPDASSAISRRKFATALPLGAALAAAAPLAGAAVGPASEAGGRGGRDPVVASSSIGSRFVFFQDPREQFRALFRFERDLKEEGEAISWYHFMMFTVPIDARPQVIVRFEGMEYSYFRRVGDLIYRIHAHNLSFPRDPMTGEFVTDVVNPVSLQRVSVPTMALLGDPGVLHGPRGYVPLDSDSPAWVPVHVMFRAEGELMKMDNVRPAPASWPMNFVESSTSSVARRLFDDPAVTSLPYQTSGFYILPWPAWTGLAGRPGHMLGAWSGRKLSGPGELPTEFVERARREHPDLLKARWGEFDRPLSAVVREVLLG